MIFVINLDQSLTEVFKITPNQFKTFKFQK
jgi:hypothetical protein